MTVNGKVIEFSGIYSLHTCFQEILTGFGFSLAEARKAIETISKIRSSSHEHTVDMYFNK